MIAEKLTNIEHLTDGQKEEIAKRQEPAVTFIEGVKADRAAKQLFENPKYNLDSIIHTLSTLKKETEAIFNRPPPKVEEPKPEADAEMKDSTENKEQPENEKKQTEAEAPVEGENVDVNMKNEEATKTEWNQKQNE